MPRGTTLRKRSRSFTGAAHYKTELAVFRCIHQSRDRKSSLFIWRALYTYIAMWFRGDGFGFNPVISEAWKESRYNIVEHIPFRW